MSNPLKKKQKPLMDLDLLSFVSHELKNPLSTLKLNIQILQKQTLKKNNIINIMEQEIEWMIQFIFDTLDIKQIDNKVGLNLKWVDWDTWIQDFLSSIKTKINFFGREFCIQKTESKIKVYIDSLYIKQALLNLLLNAVEHSPKNSKIELSWKQTTDNTLQVFISNESCIELKDINKIFEPYYKQTPKEDSLIKGSGLGLAIVKKIIQAHGGAIKASNCPHNKKSIFTITFNNIQKK